jgi:hypothetical protein
VRIVGLSRRRWAASLVSIGCVALGPSCGRSGREHAGASLTGGTSGMPEAGGAPSFAGDGSEAAGEGGAPGSGTAGALGGTTSSGGEAGVGAPGGASGIAGALGGAPAAAGAPPATGGAGASGFGGGATAGAGAVGGGGCSRPKDPPSCSSAPGCTPIVPGAVAVGVQHSCALVGDGTVKCWGDNGNGQLGTGGGALIASSAVPVVGLTNATSVAATDYGTCALTADGLVSCWGLGGDPKMPAPVAGIDDVSMIAAGDSHVCALRHDGMIGCWGTSTTGATGGTDVSYTKANPIKGIDDATFVAAGQSHSCAVRRGGSVACWGSNDSGELGDNTRTPSPDPVPVSGVGDAIMLALGHQFSCAVTTTFDVKCWGAGSPLLAPSNVISAVAKQGNACVAQLGGSFECFGQEISSELGTYAPFDACSAPTVDLAHLLGISVGRIHVCAVVGDDSKREAWCWGNGLRGQLGRGTSSSTTAVRVADFP